MPRPVTLFTGQWADLPLGRTRAARASSMGYDGLELACWGDHFDVDGRARASPATSHDKRALLKAHGLQCYAISNHLVGQAVCDLIDERHKAILPPRRLGRRRSRGRPPARGATEIAGRAARSAAPEQFGVDGR